VRVILNSFSATILISHEPMMMTVRAYAAIILLYSKSSNVKGVKARGIKKKRM